MIDILPNPQWVILEQTCFSQNTASIHITVLINDQNHRLTSVYQLKFMSMKFGSPYPRGKVCFEVSGTIKDHSVVRLF